MKRLMRLRASQHLRDLCAETEFNRAQLIQPFFVVDGLMDPEPIPGLRGNFRHNTASALKQIESDLRDGVTHFLLFPVHLFAQLSAMKPFPNGSADHTRFAVTLLPRCEIAVFSSIYGIFCLSRCRFIFKYQKLLKMSELWVVEVEILSLD